MARTKKVILRGKTKELGWEEAVKALREELDEHARNLMVFSFLYFSLVSDKANKYADAQLAEFSDVSRAGFHVLYRLVNDNGAASPTKLCSEVMRSKYAITAIVDSLERESLVTRVSLESDRRGKLIKITPKGLDLVRRSMPGRVGMCREAMTHFSVQERRNLLRLLTKLDHRLSILLEKRK